MDHTSSDPYDRDWLPRKVDDYRVVCDNTPADPNATPAKRQCRMIHRIDVSMMPKADAEALIERCRPLTPTEDLFIPVGH